MPQSFSSLHSHIIFSTKHRERWIDPEMKPRLFAYLGGIVKDKGCVLSAAGGMPDHVHLLVSLSREVSVADLLRVVKANSSRWIHETYPQMGAFAWQEGYGVFSVSYSNIDNVKNYLANQEEHHRHRTFQEEFTAFLEKHHIPYDECYVFD
jgi:putative transposase